METGLLVLVARKEPRFTVCPDRLPEREQPRGLVVVERAGKDGLDERVRAKVQRIPNPRLALDDDAAVSPRRCLLHPSCSREAACKDEDARSLHTPRALVVKGLARKHARARVLQHLALPYPILGSKGKGIELGDGVAIQVRRTSARRLLLDPRLGTGDRCLRREGAGREGKANCMR